MRVTFKRVVEFRDVRLLERHPAHRVQVDAVVVGEDAAHPGGRGDGIGAHPDPLPGELLRPERAARGIVGERPVLEAGRHHRRQEPIGLAVRLGEEEGHQRELGDVELEIAHHPLECGMGRLDVREL
jgi:hypothetical protein